MSIQIKIVDDQGILRRVYTSKEALIRTQAKETIVLSENGLLVPAQVKKSGNDAVITLPDAQEVTLSDFYLYVGEQAAKIALLSDSGVPGTFQASPQPWSSIASVEAEVLQFLPENQLVFSKVKPEFLGFSRFFQDSLLFKTVTVPSSATSSVPIDTTTTTTEVNKIVVPITVTSVTTFQVSAPTVAEAAAGGLNAAEAANGTPVVVSLGGTGAVAGDTVQVNFGGQTVLYTLTAADITAGSATVTVPLATISAQGDGVVSVSSQIIDVAGNPSAPSASFNITVDTVAPTAPASAPTVAEAGAGGLNAAEAANGTPVVVSLGGTGAVAGDTVQINFGSQTVPYTLTAADITAGSATVTVPLATISAQGDGVVSISSQIIDVAGNPSAPSASFNVTVDTSIPAVSAPNLADASDTGASNTDNITFETTGLVFNGTAEANATLTLFRDNNNNGVVDSGESLGVATATAGAWSLSTNLGVGTYNIKAIAVDAAGNTSSATAATQVTVSPALGFVINGETAGDQSGRSVSSAGDVNGDGLADLIVGAYLSDPGGLSSAGRSYVLFGKTDGTAVNLSAISAGTGGFVLNGQAAGDNSGYSVSSAGDVNGDGLADLIVGAYNANSTIGRSYVVFGKTGGAVVDLSNVASGAGGFVINGQVVGDGSGYAVSSAGDVNGDGLADLIVGAYGVNSQAGRSYVVFGKTGGGAVDLSAITLGASTGGFVINGQAAFDLSGFSVSSAGDVNGDGLADLIVGSYGSDPAAGGNAGRSYVVFGKTDGVVVDLSAIATGSSTDGFVIIGQAANEFSGWSASSAGDVNSDGLADLIVGAPLSARSYVVFGKTGGAVVDLSAITSGASTGGFVINGLADFNGFSVSSAGDVNGDGLADLIVGANLSDPAAGVDAGRSYLVFGKTSGAVVDLSAIAAGTGGFVINGQGAGDQSGISVSSAGDVNGDGLADLIVGASLSDPAAGIDAGRSYVVFGKTDTNAVNLGDVAAGGTAALAITFNGTTSVDTWTGTAAAETALGGTGNDILAGNGGADVLYGGAGNDVLVLNDTNVAGLSSGVTSGRLARVDGGTGFDTLRLDGSGITLDLTTITNSSASTPETGSRIASIEAIDLTGTGNNTLNLTAADVLDITGFNNINSSTLGWSSGSYTLSAIESRHQLVVQGNAGDVLTSTDPADSWVAMGTVTNSGNTYVVYNSTSALAQLLVNITITQNLDALPPTLSAPNLADASDTGASNTDNITFETTGLVFNGTAEANATVTLFRDDNSNGVVDSGESLGVATANGIGTWSLSTNLDFGTYNIKAIAVDAAGNTSGATAATQVSVLPAKGFVINGQAAGDQNGFTVSSAGDVNGDGLADVIVGALASDPAAGLDAGRSYVVFGKAGGAAVDLSSIAAGTGGFVLNGQAAGDNSGKSVSSAGDVNGDGLADLIVGADGNDPAAGLNAGRSYVVFGKTSGIAVDLSAVVGGTGGFAINGQSTGDASGVSVSSAGDVNGDGLADLIVGAYTSDPGAGVDAGRSYVVFGKTGGTAVDLSAIAGGTGGFVINGQALNDLSGYSVSSAGDVNGDGLADLIVGAYGGDPLAGSVAGRSYVVFGKTGGATVDLSAIAGGTGGFVINGLAAFEFSGWSVSSSGDVNGDGLADLIVGAPRSDPVAGTDAGRSYVVFGKTDGAAVDLSAIAAGTGGFVLNGQTANDLNGYSVSSAGDVNGDGLADVIVSSYLSDPAAGIDAGRNYVVFGKTSGTAVNLSAIAAGTGGFVINGQAAGDWSGYSVSSAGDVNGDGLADLIVGAIFSDPIAGTNAGRSYVVFGKTDTAAVNLGDVAAGGTAALAITFNGTTGVDTWTGTAAAETALGGTGNDILAGNGGADVLYGGAGNDVLVLNDTNVAALSSGVTSGRLARVDGGTGFDTLRLEGTGVTLNLAAITNSAASNPEAGSRIASVEAIDLTGSGNNTLNLTTADVLDITGLNNFNNGNGWIGLGASVQRHQLVVDGNAGDVVNATGGWLDTGTTVTNGGQTYEVYNATGTLAQLLVDVDINRAGIV